MQAAQKSPRNQRSTFNFKIEILLRVSTRIIHEALASTWRKPVSLGCCSTFVVSAVHPRHEIDELAKLVSASGELLKRAKQDACRACRRE
jgi:NADH:ubiquinone oxidoreductase subunit B-like Fe-S oxidoreductase